MPHRRELLADGRPIKRGGRAFDVLMALIEGRGAVISRDALMPRVWPGRIVEENSLAAQIAALRAAFGAERALIRTVSGRGYQFTGEIRKASTGAEREFGTGVPPAEMGSPTNLPQPVSALIGRDGEVGEVVNLIGAHRLVPSPARAASAGRGLRSRWRVGCWRNFLTACGWASFRHSPTRGLVRAAVAAAVGLVFGAGENSAQRVAQGLANRRLLLVLDTCEHVIEAAAAMAEAVQRAGSAVRIIATSREPLRVEAEQIYPLPPLAVPVPEAEDPWRCAAVLVFVVRSRLTGAHVSEDQHVAAIAAICRRLDGIPLAIELAAARLSTPARRSPPASTIASFC